MVRLKIMKNVQPPSRQILFFKLIDWTKNGSEAKAADVGKRLTRQVSLSCLTFTTVSCKRIVADFRFLSEFEKTILQPFNNVRARNQSRPGTLLKMLLSQVDFSDRQAYQVILNTETAKIIIVY